MKTPRLLLRRVLIFHKDLKHRFLDVGVAVLREDLAVEDLVVRRNKQLDLLASVAKVRLGLK